jgi:SAM-dependent methyltransferase
LADIEITDPKENPVNEEEGIDQTRPRASEMQFNLWSSTITKHDADVRWLTSKFKPDPTLRVLDIGGGNGQFASVLAAWLQTRVDVIDPSVVAARNFTKFPLCTLIPSDFTTWSNNAGSYDLVIFRLVLHHLIDRDNERTERTQAEALLKAASLLSDRGRIYILENIYDPLIGSDISGRLIFEATSLKRTAAIFRRLGANTAGEGVRFHSLAAWRHLLAASRLTVESESFDHGWAQPFPLWQRLPFLCGGRYQWLSISRLDCGELDGTNL